MGQGGFLSGGLLFCLHHPTNICGLDEAVSFACAEAQVQQVSLVGWIPHLLRILPGLFG